MNSLIEQFRKLASRWLNLLVAPMAISLIAIIITNRALQQSTPLWLWVITIIVLLLAILLYTISYLRGFEKSISLLTKKIRSKKFSKPRVLILDGTIIGNKEELPPNPVHSDKLPTQWKTALESLGWEVELGPAIKINTQPIPSIVVNPFGEVYLEADFISGSSISEIRNYVWSGGVYVNVSGIPFWYRYNPSSKKRENAGRVEGIYEDKPMWIPLFNDLFPNLTPKNEPEIVDCLQTKEDTERFGDVMNAGNNPKVGRFRDYPLNPPQLLPLLREKEQKNCIIGSFSYGQGSFLIAGVYIKEDNFSFEKVIAAIKGWADYEGKNRKP
jgi:hypothetical protein